MRKASLEVIVPLFIVLPLVGSRCIDEAAVPPEVLHYDLSLDLHGDSPFPATARITILPPADATNVAFSASSEQLRIAGVNIEGRGVDFTHRGDILLVPIEPGTSPVTVEVRYSVRAQRYQPQNFHGLIASEKNERGKEVLWTLTWPDYCGEVFPCTTDPSDGVTAQWHLTLADDQGIVVANGRRDEVTPGPTAGTSTHHFVLETEAPTYALAFTVGDYVVDEGGISADGVRFTSYTFPADRETAIGIWSVIPAGLDFFGATLGPYRFGEDFSLVEAEFLLGGMEHVTMPFIGRFDTVQIELQSTVIHELSHHWWGDGVRIRYWADFWLSEGFAEYAMARFYRAYEGEERFFEILDEFKLLAVSAMEDDPHPVRPPEDDIDVLEIFDSIPYRMGAWVLRMLEVRLGTETFDALLTEWFETHFAQAVETEELLSAVNRVSGADYTPFFEQWVYTAEIPQVTVRFSTNGTAATLSMIQDEVGAKAYLDVPVRFFGPAGETLDHLFILDHTDLPPDDPAATVELGFPAVEVEIDPERTILLDTIVAEDSGPVVVH